jgi:hypothetical protein
MRKNNHNVNPVFLDLVNHSALLDSFFALSKYRTMAFLLGAKSTNSSLRLLSRLMKQEEINHFLWHHQPM